MRMPTLETARLLIRPLHLDDLDGIFQILDRELGDAAMGTEGAKAREERQQWLRWTTLSYEELAKLHQPPYGERALVLRETGRLIGAVGFAPCLDAFAQLPALAPRDDAAPIRLNSTELGLFWAVSPAQQRLGYATEAALAMIEYAFATLRLRRVVATTGYDNAASIGVMRKLRMRIERNPFPEPPWLQVVGILHHPDLRAGQLAE